MVVVTWTPRDGGRRIISMRKANDPRKSVLWAATWQGLTLTSSRKRNTTRSPELTEEWFAKATPMIGGRVAGANEFRTEVKKAIGRTAGERVRHKPTSRKAVRSPKRKRA
jgi:hypothetical protein